MSGQPGHFVELKIDGEKLQRGFKCTMPPDAPCRRRPKDHELRESWTAEESTETGFACWAVEWVDAVGIEEAIYGGEFDGVLASVQVSITYEECVSIEPLMGATALEQDSITIPRPVVPFGPRGVPENDATADYLLEVIRKIDEGYAVIGGSNVTATVRKLLAEVGLALRALPAGGDDVQA